MYTSNHELKEIKRLFYERTGHGLMYSVGQIMGGDTASKVGEQNFFRKQGINNSTPKRGV